MKVNIFSPLNSCEFVLAVDSCSPHMSGTVYHRSLPEGVFFSDVTALALTVEDVLDCMDETSLPDWGQNGAAYGSSLPVQAGRVATFRLDVLFRQHCSWQGRLIWVEQGTQMKFRSFLELILALNDIFANELAETSA